MAKTYRVKRFVYPFTEENNAIFECKEGIAYELHVGQGNLANLRPEDNPEWFEEIEV